MSSSLNKVLLAGRLTGQPQLKSSTSGVTICSFSIAVNRRYRAADGSQQEETDFLEISVFGKTADHCATYLHKGSSVFLEARLRQETWADKHTGKPRHRLTLIGERVHFLDASTPVAEAGQALNDPEVNQAFRAPLQNQQNPAPQYQQRQPQGQASYPTMQQPGAPMPAQGYGEIPY